MNNVSTVSNPDIYLEAYLKDQNPPFDEIDDEITEIHNPEEVRKLKEECKRLVRQATPRDFMVLLGKEP